MITQVTRKTVGLRKSNFLLMALVGVSLMFTGCLNDRDAAPLPPSAFVSFYHAAPDATGLDIHVDGNRITNNPFNFTEIIPYNRFYTGKRNFKFTPPNAVNSLLDVELTFEADKIYSVFIADDAGQLQAFKVEDDWSEPDAENAQIRIIHLSQDAGEVEMEITNAENPFTEEFGFLDVSEFSEMEKGKYNFSIKSKTSGEVLVSANDVELKANRVYTLALRGKQSETDGNKKLNLQLITNYIKF